MNNVIALNKKNCAHTDQTGPDKKIADHDHDQVTAFYHLSVTNTPHNIEYLQLSEDEIEQGGGHGGLC